ncbi:MAG: right-handed parallel beta-helix repeat-containing protein, partial [Planctomycetota bacterium]
MRKINLNILVAVCIFLMTLSVPAAGRTIYVDPNGSADFTSIQAAIDDPFTFDGNEIEVAPGTYNEAINFLGKAIRLYSSDANDPNIVAATIIDGTGYYHVVQCVSSEGPNTILEGFTITGGNANGTGTNSRGGGMYCENSSPTVANCNFIGNFAVDGGGMFNYDSDPNVTGCTFISNSANNGGGMRNYIDSSPTVTNCTFSNNSAGSYGGGMLNDIDSCPTLINCIFTGNTAITSGGGMHNSTRSDPNVTNCVFSDNSAIGGHGGGMMNYSYSDPNVLNCTFSGNSAGSDGGGIYNLTHCAPTLTNCILWSNTAAAYGQTNGGIVTYSDIQGGWGGTGNIDEDPLFVNADNNDLRLRACSPCVDAGNNAAASPDVNDLAGNDRFVDDVGIVDTGLGTAPIVDMGAYERQFSTPTQLVHNITQDVNYCSIQLAIDDANDFEKIVVKPGIYYETIDFKGKAITLSNSDPNDPNIVAATIIDGTGYYHVIQCVSGEDTNTTLDGFTLTGGNADGGGMLCSYSSPTVINCTFISNSATYGGGMYNYISHPTVTNCTFIGNSVTSGGGGMCNYKSHPTVTNCTFTGNSADGGGGMYNDRGNPIVTNCTFSNNSARYGGGMYNNETQGATIPTVTNCTFSRNSASNRGGGMCNFHLGTTFGPEVTNCILWGNIPDQICNYHFLGDICTYYGATVTYSDVQGGWSGTGNIDANPLFVNAYINDLRLRACSPCVDAGDNNSVPLDTVDLDGDGNTFEPIPFDLAGNPRFADDNGIDDTALGSPPIVDMGAYER